MTVIRSVVPVMSIGWISLVGVVGMSVVMVIGTLDIRRGVQRNVRQRRRADRADEHVGEDKNP
jgi:hypothetical protein